MTLMRTRLTLRQLLFISICLAYCLLAILYAVLIPPWEAPDEPAHYRYVSQLAELWRPPLDSGIRQTTSFARDYIYISSNYEWYNPALGYLPTALVYAIIQAIAPQSLPIEIPLQNSLFPQDSKLYPNLFLHSNATRLEIWRGNEGLLAMRIFLTLWGIGVVYATSQAGNQLDPTGWLGLCAAGWVAFLPQFTFISASVRNDMFTNVVAAFVLMLVVKLQFNTEQINRYALGLGILIGIGTLSKYTFLYMPPIAIIAILFSKPNSPRSWIKPLLCILIPSVVIVSAYYLAFEEARSALAFTFNFLAVKSATADFFWGHLGLAFEMLFITLFYAGFGWANIIPPASWARLAMGAWLIGTAITVIQTFQWMRQRNLSPSFRAITLLGISWLVAAVGALRMNLSQFQPQGRFLFPALVAWGILIFWGAWQILSPKSKILLGIVSVGFMLVFNLYSLFFVLVPGYYPGTP
jgi:4-amino-4-deoxy-L-arabinose transferase-like glycosyltransferase